MTNPPSLNGYIEGYYGRLLTWEERGRIVERLGHLSMNAYLLAPKEDPCHRLEWRRDWDKPWWEGFGAFAGNAARLGVTVLAGLAPGIDFDYASLGKAPVGGDAEILLGKAGALAGAGAGGLCLLLDDIEPATKDRVRPFDNEGEAHAALASLLAEKLDKPVSVVPRVYADEVVDGAGGYLDAFAGGLDGQVAVFTCGNRIVPPAVELAEAGIVRAGIPRERLVLWDNLYANDYCPRRLFLGPWRGREGVGSAMLNPTGMVETDRLLLALMRAGPDRGAWRRAIIDDGVPGEFLDIAAWFDLPPDPDGPLGGGPAEAAYSAAGPDDLLKAVDALLWRWKSPLQREWYPYLMGFRADILHRDGRMDPLRVEKTFPPLLAPLAREGGKG